MSGAVRRLLSLLSFVCLALASSTASASRVHTWIDANWKFSPQDYTYTGPLTSVTGWQYQIATGITNGDITTLPPNVASGTWTNYTVGTDAFNGQAGFAWFRTTLPAFSASHITMQFLSIDDNAAVFLNSQFLTYHQGWNLAFTCDISSVYSQTSPNVVYILVQNTAGPGGIYDGVNLYDPTIVSGPAATVYNDSSWQTVQLPHDYVMSNTFSQSADQGHGFLPVNVAWYRKSVTLPTVVKGGRIWLEFDGIYRDSRIWLNGHFLGEHQSGYTSFYYDVTPYAIQGQANEIAVRVDPTFFEGWFYEGGGIYRHVWVTTVPPVHVGHWGTFVKSQLAGLASGAATSAQLTIATDVVNETAAAESNVVLQSQVMDNTGKIVGAVSTPVTIPANSTLPAVQQTVTLTSPKLWSLTTSHNQYTLISTVLPPGQTSDYFQTPFGMRQFTYDANLGLFLNGQHVEVQGVCNHQDFAGIGVGVPDNIFAWRVTKLKAMGANAWRTSHNPPATELLNACDNQGMLVLDENRHLGNTYDAKSPVGTTFTDPTDLNAMVLRDRNHPSIFMWSLCNEEGPLMGNPAYDLMQNQMQADINSLDGTRPCTAAEWGWEGATEVNGINYNSWAYTSNHTSYPTLPTIATEDASAVSTRSIYAVDPVNMYDEAYDNNLGGSWTSSEEVAWSSIAACPWIMGGFDWTGFDYHGEPTPWGWPATNSGFGIMDLCGFPKDNYYYMQSVWLPPTIPVVHILPHWTWPGQVGSAISVWVYSNGDHVELFLNGVSQGKQAVPALGHVQWSVNYAPGTLTAISYKNGVRWATQSVSTAGAPTKMTLRSDILALAANGEDISPVEVTIVDPSGNLCPTADNNIVFSVTGPGAIVGVGNGNPSGLEPDVATTRDAFNGKCMVLIRHTSGYGTITVTATAASLPTPVATFNISVPAPPRAP